MLCEISSDEKFLGLSPLHLVSEMLEIPNDRTRIYYKSIAGFRISPVNKNHLTCVCWLLPQGSEERGDVASSTAQDLVSGEKKKGCSAAGAIEQ